MDSVVNKMEDFMDDGKVNNSNVPGAKKPDDLSVGGMAGNIAGFATGAALTNGRGGVAGTVLGGMVGSTTGILEDGMSPLMFKNPMLHFAYGKMYRPLAVKLYTTPMNPQTAFIMIFTALIFGGWGLLPLVCWNKRNFCTPLGVAVFLIILGPFGNLAASFAMIRIYKYNKAHGGV